MPTATWQPSKTATIDAIVPSITYAQLYCGIIEAGGGGSKAACRRLLLYFPLTAAPVRGTAPPPGATIIAADLKLDVDIVDGAGSWAGKMHKVTRGDWGGSIGDGLHPTTNWLEYYHLGPDIRAWTSQGGDFAATPAIDFTSPAATGAYHIDVLPIVSTLFGADFNVIMKAVDENPGVTRHFGSTWTLTVGGSAKPPELTLTYEGGAPAIIDQRDPAILTGERARAPLTPVGGARAAQPARPARPRGR